MISHRSAAALRKLPGFRPALPELIVPRGRERNADGIIHRPLSLPAVDVEIVDAIPVTTVPRTLIDIAGLVSRDQLEMALDDALRRGLVSIPRLRWRLNQTARMGRPGAAKVRSLLRMRAGTSRVPQSVFETMLRQEIRRAGLPDPVPQYEIRYYGELLIADFAYLEPMVAIECESLEWHSGRIPFNDDLIRRNKLTELGWRVIHVTWDELTKHPERVIRSIERALRQAGSR